MSEETGEKNSARERFHNDVMAKYQKAKKKKLPLSPVPHFFYPHLYKCAARDHTAPRTETLQ